ncbi:DUF4328 domain-containing protein [Streptomyces stramineus]|uniref:DUF4328 domain-containing protein n=1 Tax=Streptomyces TaxID=1883 RepID=UPI0031DC3D2A
MGPDGRCATCGVYQQQLNQQPQAAPPPYPYPAAAMPLPVGGVDLRRGVRIALNVLLGVSVVVLLLLFTAQTRQREALADILDGGLTLGGADAIDDADDFVASMTILRYVTLAATATLWVIWFRRARINAEVFAPGTHRKSTGWAVGSWFTPVVNLWFPKQIADDIYRASAPAGPQSAPKGLLNAWWALWVASAVCGTISSVMYSTANARLRTGGYAESSWKDDVSALQTSLNVGAFSTLLLIVAGVLAILVVRQLSGLQERRALAGPQAGAPMGGMPYGAPGYPPVQPGPGAGGWGGPPQNPYGNGPAGY